MKLCDVPDHTLVKLIETPRIPIGAPLVNKGDKIMFYKIDGMYSFCKTSRGQICHIGALSEVEIVNKSGE